MDSKKAIQIIEHDAAIYEMILLLRSTASTAEMKKYALNRIEELKQNKMNL